MLIQQYKSISMWEMQHVRENIEFNNRNLSYIIWFFFTISASLISFWAVIFFYNLVCGMWKSFLTRADDALPFFASLFHVVDFPMNTFSPTQHELPLTSTCSGTSRYICFGTIWIVWAPQKCAQKSSCNTFPIYISCKT